MIIRILLLLVIASSCAVADIINASSLSYTDVQTAVNSASAGDTVVLPSGSAAWTGKVTWSAPANVTLKGAGTSVAGGGDQTVISDNYNANDKLFDITVSSSGVFRMTGITFESGTATTPKEGGTIKIAGPGNIRIDHCHFDATSAANYQVIMLGGGIRGVLDHSILDFQGINAIYMYNGRSGAGDQQGNYEWTQPTAFGSDDFFYIEDNIVNGDVPSGTYSTRIWDGFTAAKVVVRFNDVSQAVLSEAHATGHAPDDRGTRAQEIYGNEVTSTLTYDPNYTMVDLSSGCGLVWGNTADQVYKNIYLFNVTRKNADTYAQTATPNGWGYAGTAYNGTGSDWDGGTFNGTDTTLGYPCLDQPGRGAGDLLTGVFPNKVNDTSSQIEWPDQALEPIYIWNNTGDVVSGWGGTIYSNNSGGRVVANRDYYPQASGVQTSSSSPFDGTTGTGWGTLANRPTTCTAGVAYWATDQGSWNTSTSNPYGVQQNGADGVLYKATATDTWTEYYTPYTYPHPLQSYSSITATTFNISGP